MARYYVKKDEKWNVFSSIVDDFLYSDFMSFEELKALVIGEVVVEKLKDLETLLTNRPKLNTMPFSETIEIIKCKDEPQTDDKKHCAFCKWFDEPNVCGRCRNMNLFADAVEDEPQTDYERGYQQGKEDEHRWWSEHCANCPDVKDEPLTKCDLCRREGDEVCLDCERKKQSGKE